MPQYRWVHSTSGWRVEGKNTRKWTPEILNILLKDNTSWWCSLTCLPHSRADFSWVICTWQPVIAKHNKKKKVQQELNIFIRDVRPKLVSGSTSLFSKERKSIWLNELFWWAEGSYLSCPAEVALTLICLGCWVMLTGIFSSLIKCGSESFSSV